MKINIQYEPMPLVVFENFYLDNEIDEIVIELQTITSALQPPEHTGSAYSPASMLKQNKGIWLENYYTNIEDSPISKYSNKIFDIRLLEFLELSNPFWRLLRLSNWNHTLLSGYEHGDFYDRHYDNSTFTFITYVVPEEHAYVGGDLFFHDFDRVLKVKNNLGVLFPGSYWHSVSSLSTRQTNVKSSSKMLPRYAISKFIGHEARPTLPPDDVVANTYKMV